MEKKFEDVSGNKHNTETQASIANTFLGHDYKEKERENKRAREERARQVNAMLVEKYGIIGAGLAWIAALLFVASVFGGLWSGKSDAGLVFIIALCVAAVGVTFGEFWKKLDGIVIAVTRFLLVLGAVVFGIAVIIGVR